MSVNSITVDIRYPDLSALDGLFAHYLVNSRGLSLTCRGCGTRFSIDLLLSAPADVDDDLEMLRAHGLTHAEMSS